jgi:ubiquinone/menaquinone biosynthesis C-methylase UbiE
LILKNVDKSSNKLQVFIITNWIILATFPLEANKSQPKNKTTGDQSKESNMSNSTTQNQATGTNSQAAQGPSIEQIKAKMKATWEDGDYADFAKYMENGAIEILESWNISPNQRLLDIGCGSGQTAIPAAQQGHQVVGIDIADNLIEHAKERARYEGLDAQFDVGDAEALPYEDNSFDVVISMIGAMFAPRPEKVASEIARVLRPGGKLYMANWTAAGLPGKMFKSVAGFMPPPPGFIPPVLWGDDQTIQQRLSKHFGELQLTRKIYPQWHYPFDVSAIVDLFRTHFGPVKRAFDTLETNNEDHTPLRQQLHDIFQSSSEVLNDGSTKVTGAEFMEIIATRHADA